MQRFPTDRAKGQMTTERSAIADLAHPVEPRIIIFSSLRFGFNDRLEARCRQRDLERAMEGHILAQSQLIGRFTH